jgi:hypothetical protein
MKSEQTSTPGLSAHDELLLPSLPSRALTHGNSDELAKLKTENVRLQRLVAELLVENQQLRQRYCVPKTNAERGRPSETGNSNKQGD